MKSISDTELENTDGGFVLEALLVAGLGAAGFVAAGVINNWEEFKKGVSEGASVWQ